MSAAHAAGGAGRGGGAGPGGGAVRVYVPVTWSDLPGLRAAGGAAAGTEGYAATDALADALGLPRPATAGQEALDDLHDAAAAAAADASFLLLLAAATDAQGEDGPGVPAGSAGPARRVVVAVDARVAPGAVDLPSGAVDDPGRHPAAVVLAEDVPWSRVAAVLADDVGDEAVVREALALAQDGDDTGTEAALERLEEVALGWWAPSEVP